MTSPTPNIVNTLGTGGTSTSNFINVLLPRDPTPYDLNYQVQKRWLNISTQEEFILENFSTLNGITLANWVKISSGSFTAETLTGNSGGPVGPDSAHNINVVGDASTINVIGNPSSHTLTINAIPEPTIVVTGTTQLIGVNTNYIANSGTLITFTLPATAILGNHFRIIGMGTGGWKVDVNTNQLIHVGQIATTISTGSIASSNQWDCIYAFCVVAGTSTQWSIINMNGCILTT